MGTHQLKTIIQLQNKSECRNIISQFWSNLKIISMKKMICAKILKSRMHNILYSFGNWKGIPYQ
jgi:hypothetical protein